MRVPHEAHVLVADGAKMLFFRNDGDAEYPDLHIVEASQQEDATDGEIKTGPAGRAPSNNNRGGSSMGETDFHEQAEERFLTDAADVLNRGALANDYRDLIVVAPPKALGTLRQHYHSEVEKRLIQEVPKDLTGFSVDQIEQILVGIGKD